MLVLAYLFRICFASVRDLLFYIDSFTLRAYPPTCLYAPAIPAPLPISRDATLSPLLDRDPGGGPRDPKGTQGDQMGPKGGTRGPQGRLRRPLGGWARGARWGYSEAIPNGKLFRNQSEWKGRSEWMALPNGKLFHAFTQPRKRRTECLRICLVGFEQFS